MVTPACYTSTEVGRRYSRGCPPYSLGGYHAERRYPLPSHYDSRTSSMTERESDDASHPRKRIAVACGRCRKRKIRCSGDSGNGGPCSNCKNAGHEPCLFLRVSSTETHLRDNEYSYNVESGRAYHARGAASPVAVSPYGADMAPSSGDFSAYRQNSYTYGTKGGGYYGVSGWAGAYSDEAADYNLGYSSYPHITHDPVQLVPPGYRYGSSKGSSSTLYADPEATSSYPYSNLVHRPAAAAAAVANDLPHFSLSGMAASLPPSERLAPTHHRLANGYRGDGLPSTSSQYASSKGSSAGSIPETTGYGSFESPVPYPAAPATLPSNLTTTRGGGDGTGYPPPGVTTGGPAAAAATAAAATDALYGPPLDAGAYRSAHDTSDGYMYTDSSKLSSSSSRRDSQSSGGGGGGGGNSGAVLSNGQVYVPESHAHAHHQHRPQHHRHHHHHAHHQLPAAAATASSQAYVVSPGGGASSHAGSETAAAAATAAAPGHGTTSGSATLDGHRRSVGSLQRGV